MMQDTSNLLQPFETSRHHKDRRSGQRPWAFIVAIIDCCFVVSVMLLNGAGIGVACQKPCSSQDAGAGEDDVGGFLVNGSCDDPEGSVMVAARVMTTMMMMTPQF